MAETTATNSKPDSRAGDVVLWLAALVAFSPALRDLGVHWWDTGWPRYSLLFIPLLVRAVAKDHAGRAYPRIGVALVAFSLVAQLLAAKAAVPALSRPFIALGIIGLLIRKGSTTPRTAALAFFIIPVPQVVSAVFKGKSVAIALFDRVAGGMAGFGMDAQVIKQKWIFVGETGLTIDAAHAGLPLVFLFAGLIWYRAARTGLAWPATWLHLIIGAAAAVPCQVAAVILAIGCLGIGSAATAHFVLDYGVGIVIVPVWIYLTERSRVNERPGP